MRRRQMKPLRASMEMEAPIEKARFLAKTEEGHEKLGGSGKSENRFVNWRAVSNDCVSEMQILNPESSLLFSNSTRRESERVYWMKVARTLETKTRSSEP